MSDDGSGFEVDPDDFSGSLENRFDDYFDAAGEFFPYEWESAEEFFRDLHDSDVDHGPNSDLAHFLEDIGLRDEDNDFDVGDTPGSG